jgi:hypothetical protein
MRRVALTLAGSLAAITLSACIPPPAAPLPPEQLLLPCDDSPPPPPRPRPRHRRIAMSQVDPGPLIALVPRNLASDFTANSYTGEFQATDESFTEACKSETIRRQYGPDGIFGSATNLLNKAKGLLKKAKGAVKKGKQAAKKAGDTLGITQPGSTLDQPTTDEAGDTDEAPEEDLEELLGRPLKDPTDRVLEVLDGRKDRSPVRDPSEEDYGCTCNSGALRKDIGMCKAQVYELQKPRRVWQLQTSVDGKLPTYPFDKNWNPFAIELPIMKPPEGQTYFECTIPKGTLIAVGIAQKISETGFRAPTKQQIIDKAKGALLDKLAPGLGSMAAPPTGPVMRPPDGSPAQRPSDGSPDLGIAPSPVVNAPPPEYITMWYIGDTAGNWMAPANQPPGIWACRAVELICAPLGVCVPKPTLEDLKSVLPIPGLGGGAGGLPPIPGLGGGGGPGGLPVPIPIPGMGSGGSLPIPIPFGR